MKDWIPVFVAFAWPATLVIIIIVFCKRIRALLCIVENRIREGAALKLPGGVSVGEAVNTDTQISPVVPSSRSCATPLDGASSDVISGAPDQAVLRGVCLEIRLNEEVAESMLGDLGRLLHGNGLIPLRRLNEKATAGFIQRPLVPLDDRIIGLSWVYLQQITMFNRLVDSIDNPTAPNDYATARINQALPFRDRLKKSGSELLMALSGKLPPADKNG